jgi:MYXO-CTERM domain-containing protein
VQRIDADVSCGNGGLFGISCDCSHAAPSALWLLAVLSVVARGVFRR